MKVPPFFAGLVPPFVDHIVSLIATPSSRPSTLQLVQVRLPPGYASNAPPQRPHQVHNALYSRGILFLAASSASDNDVVWTLSNALFPATPQLCETQNTFTLDGKTWALAEVTVGTGKKCIAGLPNQPPPAPEPPLIVTQHSTPPRRFVFLTTQCCHIVTQLRPVDILRQLLIDASGPDSTAVRAFFQVCLADLCYLCRHSIVIFMAFKGFARGSSVRDGPYPCLFHISTGFASG